MVAKGLVTAVCTCQQGQVNSSSGSFAQCKIFHMHRALDTTLPPRARPMCHLTVYAFVFLIYTLLPTPSPPPPSQHAQIPVCSAGDADIHHQQQAQRVGAGAVWLC
jgi:hypothetical protein